MANLGQSTFVGSEVRMTCDGSWNCCQRQQAKAKVDHMNKECPLTVRGKLPARTNRVKKRAQAREARAMDRMTPAARASVPPAVSQCVADQLKGPPPQSRSDLKLEMDHRTDTKWGGASDPGAGGFAAMDSEVNNFFGKKAQVTGKDMRAGGESQVTSFSIVCDPPCNPPHAGGQTENHCGGAGKAFPKNPPNEVSPRPK